MALDVRVSRVGQSLIDDDSDAAQSSHAVGDVVSAVRREAADA